MRALTALLCALVLSACRHPLAIQGQGDIVDAMGSGYGCTLEQQLAGDAACIENDVVGEYIVDYMPIPRQGWKFVRWDGACGPASTWPVCNFTVSAPLLAYWDQDFGDVPIPPLKAVFEPLGDTDADVDYAGSFAVSSLALNGRTPNTPTISFDVDVDGRISWWLELGVVADKQIEAQSRIDIYNSFRSLFHLSQVDGQFIDRDAFVGRVINVVNKRHESFFVGRRIDLFPDDPAEDSDSDRDGIGNNADAFPGDATESQDSDGDGVGDNRDAYPHNAAQAYDADGDGIADGNDAFPVDPNEYTDTDDDGVGDNADHFPFDPERAYTASSDLFSSQIAGNVLQARCLNCHYAGGLSGHTRLVFDATPGPGQNDANQAVFAAFVAGVDNAREYILSKIQGVDHGGGSVFSSGSDEFAVLAEYLAQLTGESGTRGGSNLATFWNGVRIAGSSTTLRRAAIILARRLPTAAEYQLAEGGDAGLWQAVRGLMTGAGFHDFLIRGANDRLLTAALTSFQVPFLGLSGETYYPLLRDRFYELLLPAQGNLFDPAAQSYWDYLGQLHYGGAYEPLELIAHVVENELPYTEILTADYTMVNPQTAQVYRAEVLEDQSDPTIFVPARNRGQIVVDEATVEEIPFGMILPRVLSHSGFIDYPHAGVLSSPAFLNRYPSTETNRNRARARWTYYHFLGVDIEKSAGRTTDPQALADTNNPTTNNPACSVCHHLHDPVAGAFQNHGHNGAYRENGGIDSLPASYKTPEAPYGVPVFTPYQPGDSWYRDMRPPGIDGKLAPDASTSLPWLAREIANDPRFASASIRFWWQALMGTDPAEAPEAVEDFDFQGRLRAFEAQRAVIEELAQGFRAGFNGGAAYNLKDLLTAMVIGPWFRADGGINSLSARTDDLRGVGTRRLLTTEELSGKVTDLIDVSWAADSLNAYGGYYGGIDSFTITRRARSLTTLMANVPELQAYSLSCAAVHLDFNLPDHERRIFGGISHTVTPQSGSDGEQFIRAKLVALHKQFLNEDLTVNHAEIDATYQYLVDTWEERQALDPVGVDWSFQEECDQPPVEPEIDADSNQMVGTWVAVLIYLMTDFYFLHE